MTIATLLLAVVTAVQPSAAASEPVLLDFHANWCGPCRQMRPAIEELARRGYPIKSIDIDQAPDLAEKYNVQAVPTFIVADGSGRELSRTSGAQPAGQLARFYLDAKSKAQPPANSNAHAVGDDESDAQAQDGTDEDADEQDPGPEADPNARPEREDSEPDEPVFTNPKPWETVVRIRVLGRGSVGFGSGTIIHSSPRESVILTCAHIFKLDGQRQVSPDRFPRKIMIDLFDGKLQGTKPAQVHFVESVEGKAVDYDFTLDVGLIKIRPGRRLPASRVVPAHWEPRARMKMMTVGCSEGQDATAWYTMIQNPGMRGLSGNPSYEAIECMIAPKQGRSGGGLYTTDGYVAGVCNFAEPRGNHGLYATPRSIYSMLDRNNLMALYAPVSRGSATLVADRGSRSGRNTREPATIARGQSPDRDEPERMRGRPGDVTIPPPELLGIRTPRRASTSTSTRRTAWQPTHNGGGAVALRRGSIEPDEKTEQTDLNLDRTADHDRFAPIDNDRPIARSEANQEDLPTAPPSVSNTKTRWRPVKSGEANQDAE